jgi:hypothetical protein
MFGAQQVCFHRCRIVSQHLGGIGERLVISTLFVVGLRAHHPRGSELRIGLQRLAEITEARFDIARLTLASLGHPSVRLRVGNVPRRAWALSDMPISL